MSTVSPRRRGVARATGILTVSLVAGGGMIASTASAVAQDEISVNVDTYSAADFVEVAADLPVGLIDAIQRDLDLKPAEYLARAEVAKSAADAAANLRIAGVDVLGASVDGHDVTLHVETEADARTVAVSGAKVEVGGLREFKGDRQLQPAADHKGGYGYTYVAEEDADTGESFLGRCSVGFSGYDAEGNDRFLTAGHCAEDESTGVDYTSPISHVELDEPIWGTDKWVDDFPGPGLGEFVPGSVHFGELQDGALVDVTNDDWAGVPQVAGWDGGGGDPDAASINVLGTIEAVAGAEACKSGSTSGWTCGEILAVEDTADVGTKEVSGFIFNACMLAGDSGGSIVVGSYALGVSSGSSHEERANCDTWVPATIESPDDDFSVGYAVSGGEHNATTLFDGQWELSVSINTPTVTAPGEDGETGPTPTFTGTVQGARSTHRVRVAIDGQEGYTAQVANDGSFSIPVTDPLEPGEHTYVLRAAFGEHSVSEPVEGSFTSTELQVEQLAVTSPADGKISGSPRPDFNGTGQPGATVTLTIGDGELGQTTVAEGGSWTLTPAADLPIGKRFDVTLTQTFQGETQQVSVSSLGIKAPPVTVTAPEDGSTVTGGATFTGTAFPAATITLTVDGVATANAAAETAAETEVESWAGRLDVDAKGAWSFAPTQPLEPGEYTLTASAAVDGGDPALTESEVTVSFTVADDEGGTSLPNTGSSNTWLIFVGIGLLALGGVAVAIRARRNQNAG